MAISYVQGFYQAVWTTGATNVITVPAGGCPAGNLLVIATLNSNQIAVSSIADSRGNTYTLEVTNYGNSNPGVDWSNGLAYCVIGTALQAADTITVTYASSAFCARIARCFEYTGNALTAVKDVVNSGQDATSPKSQPSAVGVTTTNADDLIFATNSHNEGFGYTATSGFTGRSHVDGDAWPYRMWVEDKIVAATGTYSSLPALSSDAYWNTIVIAFKAAITSQYARPDTTSSAGAWLPVGAATLHEALDETTPSDSDYAEGPVATASPAAFKVTTSNITDPAVSTGHKVRYRIGKNSSGGDAVQVTVRLKQGGTTIGSWVRTVPDTPTTYEETLTGGEADAITDYTLLDLEFEEVKI